MNYSVVAGSPEITFFMNVIPPSKISISAPQSGKIL